jgi:hypothetical protein
LVGIPAAGHGALAEAGQQRHDLWQTYVAVDGAIPVRVAQQPVHGVLELLHRVGEADLYAFLIEQVGHPLLRGGLLDHSPEEGEQGGAAPGPLVEGVELVLQLREAVLGDRLDEFLLGREMPEHGADREPGAPSDLLGRGGGAQFGEDLLGGLEDACPIALRIGPSRAACRYLRSPRLKSE